MSWCFSRSRCGRGISFLSSGFCDFLDERGTVEGFWLYRCLRSIPCVRISHREGWQFPIRPSAVTLSFGQQCVEAGFRIGRGSRQECHRRLLAQPWGLTLKREWCRLAGEPGGLNLALDAVKGPDHLLAVLGALVAGCPVLKSRVVMSLSAGCGKKGRSPAHTTTSSSSRHGRGDCRGWSQLTSCPRFKNRRG